MIGENEHIMTDIDYCDEAMLTLRAKQLFNFKNQNGVASSAVLTDYDIADEVFEVKNSEYHYKNMFDNVKEDRNIDDLVKLKQR